MLPFTWNSLPLLPSVPQWFPCCIPASCLPPGAPRCPPDRIQTPGASGGPSRSGPDPSCPLPCTLCCVWRAVFPPRGIPVGHVREALCCLGPAWIGLYPGDIPCPGSKGEPMLCISLHPAHLNLKIGRLCQSPFTDERLMACSQAAVQLGLDP